MFFLGALDVRLKPFAKRTDIDLKDGRFNARVVLPGDDRLFGGIHAAYR
jgi:hypothetical protein